MSVYPGTGVPLPQLTGAEPIPVVTGGAVQTLTTSGAIAALAGTSGLSPTFGSVTLTSFLYESSTDNITAYGAGGQTNATQLTTELNRISTASVAGASVMLPPSAKGLTIIVENAAANSIQVFGSGTDQINGVAAATGVSQMAGSECIYCCYSPGNWYVNGLGTGYYQSLQTVSSANNITAHAGGGQASAVSLGAMQNTLTTVASIGDSVILPTGAAGLQLSVINNGASIAAVYCPSGGTMNGVSNGSYSVSTGSVTLFFCNAASAWLSK